MRPLLLVPWCHHRPPKLYPPGSLLPSHISPATPLLHLGNRAVHPQPSACSLGSRDLNSEAEEELSKRHASDIDHRLIFSYRRKRSARPHHKRTCACSSTSEEMSVYNSDVREVKRESSVSFDVSMSESTASAKRKG
ncbi:unnamed protein product [Urochloa humidicola]